MSLWSSIKKLGRAIDPTNKNSAIGQQLAKGLDGAGAAFGIPPGVISGGLAAAGAANANKVKPGAPPGGAVLVGPSPAMATLTDMMSKPTTWLGLAAVAALVVLLKKR
jgi:hypothetical protein